MKDARIGIGILLICESLQCPTLLVQHQCYHFFLLKFIHLFIKGRVASPVKWRFLHFRSVFLHAHYHTAHVIILHFIVSGLLIQIYLYSPNILTQLSDQTLWWTMTNNTPTDGGADYHPKDKGYLQCFLSIA